MVYSYMYIHNMLHVTCAFKISEWIHGSNDKEINKLHTDNATMFASGAHLIYSADMWRTLLRQTSLLGLLNREMVLAQGHNKFGSLVINTYQVSQEGHNYLQSLVPLHLPAHCFKK